MNGRDFSGLDVGQLCSVFDGLGGLESDFKDDVVAEMVGRLFDRYPHGFDPKSRESGKPGLQKHARWLQVFERVKDREEFFARQEKAFAACSAATEPSFYQISRRTEKLDTTRTKAARAEFSVSAMVRK